MDYIVSTLTIEVQQSIVFSMATIYIILLALYTFKYIFANNRTLVVI